MKIIKIRIFPVPFGSAAIFLSFYGMLCVFDRNRRRVGERFDNVSIFLEEPRIAVSRDSQHAKDRIRNSQRYDNKMFQVGSVSTRI